MDAESLFTNPFFLIALPILGFVVGTAVGASGIGGAALLLPSLIFIGVPPQLVVGADLAFNLFSKSFGTALHTKKHNISWQGLFYVTIVVIPSMLIASFVWGHIKENYGSETLDLVILVSIPTILLSVGVYMVRIQLLQKKAKGDPGSEDDALALKTNLSTGDKSTLMGIGGVVSFIMQITSVGAGTILVPALLKVIRSPRHVAGTSVLFGVVSTAVGTALHGGAGNVPWALVGILLIGSIPGVKLGVRVASTVSAQKLTTIFTVVIFTAAFIILSKTVQVLVG